MELAPANVSLSFEVTFDRDDLHVGMSVYDTTGLSPILVQGPAAMTNIVANTYSAKFTGTEGHSYVIFKAVYLESGLTTLDTEYSQGSESIIAEVISGGGGGSSTAGCAVLGFILNNDELIGLVNC